jgi:TldD protein
MNLTRRDFLKIGAGATAGIAFPSTLGAGLFWGKKQGNDTVNSYYALFAVDDVQLKDVFATALSNGGDYCDIFFQNRIRNDLVLEDNIVSNASSTLDRGVGIRVIKGDQTGYSFTEEITPEAMKSAASIAAGIADSNTKIRPVELKLCKCKNYYKIDTPWQNVDVTKKIALLHRLNHHAFSLDKRIEKCRVRYRDESTSVLLANSQGQVSYDFQPLGTVSLLCIAKDKGRREEYSDVIASRHGGEFLDQPCVRELAAKVVNNTVSLFDAAKINGGEMEVVLVSGGRNGVLLHEAIGHGMEADFNRKGVSIFADKIGKPVAQKFVTIIDDGTCLNQYGSINIDDEGIAGQRTVLVRDGLLESYLHDHISSKHYSLESTGSGRRESFRFSPMPRMRNTCMLNGPHDPEEIIKSVKYGLCVERVGNGQVMIGAGDFSFYVISGRLIENGKLTRLVKDVNIIGNGPQVLKDICMVGNDFAMGSGGGMCGKNGQSVPVSFGMPTVKISKITVGAA